MRNLLIGLICLQFFSMLQAAESLSVLLQKGIFAEETEGNLDAAIKIYEGMLKGGDANRALLAQAQFRLGVCELKRGKKEEAEGAFRKAVSQFSDQAEIIAKAREQLIEMGKSVSAVVVRQVWSGKDASGDSVSPDGRNLAFMDWNSGNLSVRDLTSGQSRRLTVEGSWKGTVQFAESCAFAPDGRQIAYSWYGTNDSYGLYLLGLVDPKSRTIIAQQTNHWFSVEDWSPDGKSIAVFDYESQGTNSIGGISLIAAASGSIQKITPIREKFAGILRFSPDGRYLAFSTTLGRASWPRSQVTNDIFVVEVQSGIQSRIVEHTRSEQLVGWSPSGSQVLFTSDRRGTVDLWSLEIEKGAGVGQPKLLKADLGNLRPVGLTRNGAFFYVTQVDDIRQGFIALIDLNEGKYISPPKLIPMGFSSIDKYANHQGKYQIYRSGSREFTAHLVNVETLQEREIPNSRAWAGRVGWWWLSPDAKFLQVTEPSGFDLVNTQTGEFKELALNKNGVTHRDTRNAFRGDSVLFFRRYTESKRFALVKHNLISGQETEQELRNTPEDFEVPSWQEPMLFPDNKTVFFSRKSPDGKYALVGQDMETGKQKEFLISQDRVGFFPDWDSDLVMITTKNEQKRPIVALYSFKNFELQELRRLTVPDGFDFLWQRWGKESSYALLTKTINQKDSPHVEFWKMDVKTGELKRTEISVPTDRQSVNLDDAGKRLAFQTVTPGMRELWVMENFLPPVAEAK